MTQEHNGHIDPERMQAFLDGEISQEEMAVVQEHTVYCARCRSELEAWEMLFSDLDELEDEGPSVEFSDRVMAGLAQPTTVEVDAKGWLWQGPRPISARHLTPGRIQDYLDVRLSARRVNQVQLHLTQCELCSSEMERCTTVMTALEGLPQLAPSDGFSERVMAQWRVESLITAVAPPTVSTRIKAWLGGFLPVTRKGWAVVTSAAAAPPAIVAFLSFFVFSHPLVTPSTLASFLWWKISDVGAVLASGVKGAVLESATLFKAYAVLDAAAGSPLIVGAGVFVFCFMALAALWVLYRYLIATQSVNGRYAQVSH
jgi:anti-sigma factor RsiW